MALTAAACGARRACAASWPATRSQLTVMRSGGSPLTVTAKLKATTPADEGGRGRDGRWEGFGKGGRRWDDRHPAGVAQPSYKLAIIGVEYPDVKHNPKIKDADWEASMFSTGTYTGKSATGQTVYGSMNDYYKELSYGKFKVEGKFVGWVEVGKKRMEYSSGSGTSTRRSRRLLTEAMDLYRSRRQGRAEGLRRRVLPVRRRPGDDDPRRAVLAAPGNVRHGGQASRTSSCRRAATG